MYRSQQDLQLGRSSGFNIIIQNEDLRNKFKQLLNNLHIGGCNVFVDSVVIAAYTQCDQWLDELNAYIKSNMDYFSEQVNAIASSEDVESRRHLSGMGRLPWSEHDRRTAERLL